MDDDARHHTGSLGFPDYEHYSYALALHGQHALDDMDMDNWKLFGQQDSSAMSLHHGGDSQHLQTPAGPTALRANANPWAGLEAFSTAGGLLSISPVAPPVPAALAAAAPRGGGEDDAESTCDSDCSGSEICHDSTCSDDPAVCCEDETCLLKDDVRTVAGENMTTEDAIAAAALASFVEQMQSDQQQPPQTQQLQPSPSPMDERHKQLQYLQLQLHHLQQLQQQQQQQQQQEQQRQQRQQLQHQHQHQQMQMQMQQKMLTSSTFPLNGQQNTHTHNHNHTHNESLSLSSAPSCLQLCLLPDLCISPQFLTNYQHLCEAHNPLQPTSCSAPLCPVEDPSFYQECHIRHVADPPGGLFNNIDLDALMNNHEHYHDGGVECGAKFSTGEAMIQHLWHEHCAAQQQWPVEHPSSFVSSVSPSVVSLHSHDPTQSPSLMAPAREPCALFLPDASLPIGTSNEPLPSMPPQEKPIKTEALSVVGHNTEEKPMKSECLWCDTVGGKPCGQIFDEPGDLHKHVLATHTQQLGRDTGGTYSCGWHGCSRRAGAEKGGFAQKSKIERHMQVHTGNKPFTCDICFQSFSANQALLQHKLIHQDSKPLACDICGKTFRQHSALTMHIRTHTKVRPLKCPYCHKEFSESSNLSKHKRIHAGEGQYECQFPGCKRTFHRKDQLRRHSALHTRGTAAPAAAPIPTSAPVAEQ